MGCGSSSLKGEKVDGLGGETATPARKVQTNFSDVDFTSGATADRRGTTAVAPDEQNRRPTKVSEASVEAPDAPSMMPETRHDGANLEPYKTIDGGEALDGSAVSKKKEGNMAELPGDMHTSNEEAAALATVGTDNTNPIRVA